MTSQLQNILDLIRQSEQLSNADKVALEKALKEADKAFEITNFKLDRTEKVKHTTAVLLEETIAELEQKRKAVEVQNRELEIEAALEKVRSRALSMHKSEELKEVVTVLFQKLQELEFGIDKGAALVMTYSPESKDHTQWITDATQTYAVPFFIPFTEHSIALDQIHAREKQLEFYSKVYDQNEKNEYFRYLFQHTEYKHVPYDVQELILNSKDFGISIAFEKHSAIAIPSTVGKLVSGDEIIILKRFARVFEQSYTRFLDLQKAEAQAREAQIQLALERVRARTMAMQSSEELAEVSYLLNKQVVELGIPTRGCAFNIYNEHDSTEWFSNLEGTLPAYKTPRENIFLKYYEAGQRGETLWTEEFGGDKIKEHYKYLATLSVAGKEEDTIHEGVQAVPEYQIDHVAYFKYGYLLFITLVPAPEAHDVFKRFAKEFEQTYTRFLDLQKAEALAREAHIEAALERVRSRSMAMHKSDELLEAGEILFSEMQKLGIDSLTAGFVLMDKEEKNGLNYTPDPSTKKIMSLPVIIPHNETIHMQRVVENWKKEISHYVVEMDEEETIQHQTFIAERSTNFTLNAQQLIAISPARLFLHNFYFKEGYLLIVGGTRLSAEQIDIMLRFAKVFQQTYTRFLDLQKAEAQVREAQIEAALERVRSRSMAMHKSEELRDVIQLVFEQLVLLNFDIDSAQFDLNYKESDDLTVWTAIPGQPYPSLQHIPYTDTAIMHSVKQAKEKELDFFSHTVTFEEKNEFFRHFFKHVSSPVPEERKNYIFDKPAYARSVVFLNNIFLGIQNYSGIPYSEAENSVLRRFGKVFEQSYTRFLDLQKAETQAREALIEAALERVRSKAMTMQTSDDLNALIGHIFTECTKLGLTLDRCLVQIVDPHTLDTVWILANPELPDHPSSYLVKYHEHPPYLKYLEAWKNKTERWQYVLGGKEKRDWDDFIFKETGLAQLPEPAKNVMRSLEKILLNSSFGNFGNLTFSSFEPLTEHQFDLLIRFAKVLELTYTRFNDLKQAEARAKEAVKQAALDRVRADIASMRNTADLDRITPLIWKELTTLGIPFIRCGVFIMDDKENKVHTYLSTPEGRAIAAYHTPMNDSGSLAGAIEHWRQQKVFVTRWVDSDFQLQADVLLKQGSITSREQYLNTLPKGGFYLHFLPFSQGMLYVGSHESLPSEVLQLVQSLADAFSVAYARYEDFTKLESAKAQIEKTLTDLKQTQTQLIQSEKMASLGELTAGIAHEIQNPLNFVNNFSEVSSELIDEMKEELAVGNQQSAIEIANDLKQNLEKINHHGKRADGIVKSMLQHSRKSNNQKELTDINALCDEYLRLSYHGLRAKDKSFNAKFEIQCDPELPKLNVLPQDVGRVILNLINNAFYAVSERSAFAKAMADKQGENGHYEPTVIVRTQRLENAIEIRVKDNGTGIPAKVKEKIFQPFFTTKPTGQGTGLGLSLSYDIITKGHGGEIKMETEEGKGTEFIVQLPIV